MTNKAKALGLPTDEEIIEIAKTKTIKDFPASKVEEFNKVAIHLGLGNKLWDLCVANYSNGMAKMRSEAESRIKEVAEDFDQWKFRNGWVQILDSIYRKETWLNASGTHKRQDDVSFDELFDIYLKEMEGRP